MFPRVRLFPRPVKWRWPLALVQFAFAVAIYLREPYALASQIHAFKAAHPGEIVDWGYLVDHSPTPLMRMVYAINFPAKVLASFIGAIPIPTLFQSAMYTVGPDDVAFFVFVFLLWYWIGKKLEESMEGKRLKSGRFPRWLVLAIVICGLVLAGVVGFTAVLAAASPQPPLTGRLVAVAAMVWSAIFLVYFARVATRVSRRTGRPFVPE